MPATGDKLRFRFAKTGTLRLLSHHDLMRCLERMLRRASLPFKSTAGFHPSPRIVLAQSLSLGVLGREEVLEIEFLQPLDADSTLATLREQSPLGLDFTSVRVVPMKATAVPRRIVYRIELPPERVAATASRCADFLAQNKLWVNRMKPNPKQLNIRPYLRGMTVDPLPDASGLLTRDLWVTQTGTARVDELLKLLDVADLLDAGAIAERAVLEIRDEFTNTDAADVPPDGPADTLPLDPATIAELTRKEEELAAASWAISPAGPVVE